jgi:hypothetical protein
VLPTELLYINAPRAVNEEVGQDTSLKEINAVVPPDVGDADIDNTLPPAVYPVPVVSLAVVYTVVDAPKVADDVYKAILYVLPPGELKF